LLPRALMVRKSSPPATNCSTKDTQAASWHVRALSAQQAMHHLMMCTCVALKY